MAKKKKSIETTVQVDAPIEPVKPQDNLLPCTVARNFVDGNMAGEFGKLGYGVEWVKGERRKLPMRLIERVRNSGGEIELLRG